MTPIFTPLKKEYSEYLPEIMIRSPYNGLRIADQAITTVEHMPDELITFLSEATVEHMVLVITGTDLKPISYSIVAKGAINEMTFSLEEILRCCLLTAGCHRCFLLHNHPSVPRKEQEQPIPSLPDKLACNRIATGLRQVGFQLADFLIVGPDKSIFSFASEDLL